MKSKDEIHNAKLRKHDRAAQARGDAVSKPVLYAINAETIKLLREARKLIAPPPCAELSRVYVGVLNRLDAVIDTMNAAWMERNR